MSIFRKIVVDDVPYEWKYSFDDYDLYEDSYLIFRRADKQMKLIIYFRHEGKTFEAGYCPFNFGLEAVRNGEPVVINLNQPRFAAELLRWALATRLPDQQAGNYEFRDGTQMLHELGYEFEYHLN